MKIFHKRRHHGNAFGYHTKRRAACDVSRVSLLKNIKEQNTADSILQNKIHRGGIE